MIYDSNHHYILDEMKKEEEHGNPDPLFDGFLVHYLTTDHKTQHQEMSYVKNGWGTTV